MRARSTSTVYGLLIISKRGLHRITETRFGPVMAVFGLGRWSTESTCRSVNFCIFISSASVLFTDILWKDAPVFDESHLIPIFFVKLFTGVTSFRVYTWEWSYYESSSSGRFSEFISTFSPSFDSSVWVKIGFSVYENFANSLCNFSLDMMSRFVCILFDGVNGLLALFSSKQIGQIRKLVTLSSAIDVKSSLLALMRLLWFRDDPGVPWNLLASSRLSLAMDCSEDIWGLGPFVSKLGLFEL